jgi:beta-xylosidase
MHRERSVGSLTFTPMDRARWTKVAAAAVAVIVVVAMSTPAFSQAAVSKDASANDTGAVYNGNFPDPSILVANGRYYAYATQSDGTNIQLIVSTDLIHWSKVRDALPSLPGWASTGFTWAPSVAADPSGGYEMFYVAHDRSSGLQCIGRATSASPLGPFVDHSTSPFLCQITLGGSIDPYVFSDGGLDYLVWKSDGSGGQAQQIWAQQLNADDDAVVGSSSLLLSSTSSWEDGIVEGPAMLQTSAGLLLYFSGNRWSSSSYAIGAVRCDSPLGPCVNAPTGKILSSISHVVGPGGSSFFTARDGETMMAYAAWSGGVGSSTGRRELFLTTVRGTGTLS